MSSPSQYVDLTKYQKIRQIGKGVFGEVYLVKKKETQNTYAAKIIQSEATDKPQDVILYLSREVNITAGINHPAVLHLIGFSPTDFENNSNPVIITELLAQGSLSDIILCERQSRAPDEWTEVQKRITIFGIASGFENILKGSIKRNRYFGSRCAFSTLTTSEKAYTIET